MDSGYCNAAVCQAVCSTGAYFSVTARLDPAVKAAIASIPGDAWTLIRYPRAVWADQIRAWVSDAAAAETEYTAFASKKGQAISAPADRPPGPRPQPRGHRRAGELFTTRRYHAVFTNSPFTLLQAEEQHRDHAEIEQVFADCTDGLLAHLPSGRFTANAAIPRNHAAHP